MDYLSLLFNEWLGTKYYYDDIYEDDDDYDDDDETDYE